MQDDLSDRIHQLLVGEPYPPRVPHLQQKVFELFRDHVLRAMQLDAGYGNYAAHWPMPVSQATCVADLPWLPVSTFKREPPFSLVHRDNVLRVLSSSATTGQAPSRIPLDRPTAQRMNRGAIAILRDYIGATRRPYLVLDAAATNVSATDIGARVAAIRALSSFSTTTTYALQSDLSIDFQKIMEFNAAYKGKPVIIYGFTSILWEHIVTPLLAAGVRLNLSKAILLHSGGWKKLQAQAVNKQTFNSTVAEVFGCAQQNVIDYYGMVENLGVVYPDCSAGNKHVPIFGSIIIRSPLTMLPVSAGEIGLLQVGSVLPTSFPGHLLLTDDLATVVAEDGCPCGRPGIAFRFAGRVPKAEVRGCGNIERRTVS